jgi:hypothetical protein
MTRLARVGDVWTPKRGPIAPDIFASHSYDFRPKSPDSKNLEVIDQQPDTTPANWTIVTNNGTAASQASCAGIFNNAGPTLNRWSLNSDLIGRWILAPASTKQITVYRTFAPGTGATWGLVAKVHTHSWGAPASLSDDRISLNITKNAPTTTDGDATGDCVHVELRPEGGGGGGSSGTDLRSYVESASVLSGTTQIELPNYSKWAAFIYLGLTGESDDSVTCWFSVDGITWGRITRYTSGFPSGNNIGYAAISMLNNGGLSVGSFSFLRFGSSTNLSKLGFGSAP